MDTWKPSPFLDVVISPRVERAEVIAYRIQSAADGLFAQANAPAGDLTQEQRVTLCAEASALTAIANDIKHALSRRRIVERARAQSAAKHKVA